MLMVLIKNLKINTHNFVDEVFPTKTIFLDQLPKKTQTFTRKIFPTIDSSMMLQKQPFH